MHSYRKLTTEFPMAGVDMSAQFEQIPEQAKFASDELKAATQRSRDELRSAATAARDRAMSAAGRIQKTAAADDGASSRLQQIRVKFQEHLATVQADLDGAGDDIESSYAIADADLAESYAVDAIDFGAGASGASEEGTAA